MSTQPPEDTGTEQERQVSWTSPEIIGEIVLLGIVLLLAITFIVEMGDLRPAGRYLPIITLLFVTPFWFMRLWTLFQRKKALEQGLIMDLGFRFGGDLQGQKRRAVQYVSAIALLFLLVWAVGFHIALPLWVMGYLFLFARINPLIIIAIGVAFEGLLLGVHDYIIDVPWPNPLLFQWLGIDYIFRDWPITGTY